MIHHQARHYVFAALVSVLVLATFAGASRAQLPASPSIGPWNPNQLAILRWYSANQVPNTFVVGTNPGALAFDGANIWTANFGTNNVTKLRANDGACVLNGVVQANSSPCTFKTGGVGPEGLAFDGASIWVANNKSGTVTKLLASTGSYAPPPVTLSLHARSTSARPQPTWLLTVPTSGSRIS